MIYILIFLSGMFEGYMDVLQFHWQKFKNKHRKSDSWFWSPALSWKNKYKDKDPVKGEKFLFSTTFLVSLTDGWHLMKLLKNYTLFGAIFFVPISTHIAIVVLLMYGVNRIGFNLVYKIIYK